MMHSADGPRRKEAEREDWNFSASALLLRCRWIGWKGTGGEVIISREITPEKLSGLLSEFALGLYRM